MPHKDVKRWEDDILGLMCAAKDKNMYGHLREIEKAPGIRCIVILDSVVLTCCNRLRDTVRKLRVDSGTCLIYG